MKNPFPMKSPPPMSESGRQRGVALIMAMLVVALATTAATALISREAMDVERTANLLESDQAWAYVEGGEAWARMILARDLKDNKTDSAKDEWAQLPPPIQVPGGYLAGNIEDLQGRFNLNNVVTKEGKTDTRAMALFQRLLRQLGLDEGIAQAVADWIDADVEARAPGGAEDDFYAGLSPPYRTPNRPMADVSELRLVRGVTPEVYDKLAPYVTALPERTPININTAAPIVVAAAAEGLPLDVVREVLARRETRPFDKPADFFKDSQLGALQIKGDPQAHFSTDSHYFLVRVEARIGRGRASTNTVLQRQQDGQVRILLRLAEGPPAPPAAESEDTETQTGE
jgi:general secretion pathway protein K